MIELRDGTTTEDPKLDRLKQFDPRSRSFGVAERLAVRPLRGKTWWYPGAPYKSRNNTDQGREGACVGFGWTNELISTPRAWKWDNHTKANSFAQRIYKLAQIIDPWPGEAYEGTSVLAGAQVMQREKYIGEYRWAFDIDEVMHAVVQYGPVVVGTDWTDDMEPRPSGLLQGVTGNVKGGHCYLLRGLILKPRIRGEANTGPVFVLTNSWGDAWGKDGDAYIRVSDFETLMKREGEVCVPVGRG
jgi:hypothetical protein